MTHRRMRAAEGRDRSRGESLREDAGFVIALFALMAVTLVGFAGFAVDLGHWYLTASRLQNAADASALAGVVFLPDEFETAEDVSIELANGHGYEDAEVRVAPGDRPNQLRVTITREVDNFFLPLFGISRTTLTRTALAEFEGPVPMGSPENFLGNDPERGVFPDHWMNAGSVRNNVGNGDRYNNGRNSGSRALGPDTPGPGSGVNNPDYRHEGIFYSVEVTPGSTGPLVIQIFDPALYEVGDTCGNNPGFNLDPGELQAHALANPDVPDDWYDDAYDRYGNYSRSPRWCTGDFLAGGSSGGGGPSTTSYIVRAPDSTPWLDTDNPVVNTTSCQPRQFSGMDNNGLSNGGGLRAKLLSEAQGRVTFPDGQWEQTVANSFRRWVTVCEIPNPQVGEYLLQVRTSVPYGENPATYMGTPADTWGHNRYSIRAGIGDDPDASGWSNGVRVFAKGRMPIYVNANGADTAFYLARVVPGGTERVLNVSLWDISDIGQSGSMRIVPPPDSGLTNFSDCLIGSSGGSFASRNGGTCSFSFNSSGLNEQLVQVSIPIPNDYSCDHNNPMGCWITVETPVTGAANDTTTWSANIMGDPVRLVE